MPEQRKRTVHERGRKQRKTPTARDARNGTGSSARVTRHGSMRSGGTTGEKPIARLPILKIAVVVALLIGAVCAVSLCSSAMTIEVTVNGVPCTLRGAKTMQTAIKESGLPINPGDLISLQGAVLKRSAGEPFAAVVNGEETSDPEYRLHAGDTITVTDGNDTVEDYDTEELLSPRSAVISGAGAIRVFNKGSDGVTEVRTGRISGEEVRYQISDPVDSTCVKHNPDVGADKVIALTFDGGPSEEYTADILDILQENEAHATFFCVGMEIEKYNDYLVQREHDEGHQVCTNTYGRVRSTGSASIAAIDAASLVEEVERGRQAIADALGGEEASRIVRLPGNELNEAMVRALDAHVQAEIGWNVDTGDWLEPGSDAIFDVLTSLTPGDIVLCHDGGGDRAGTVEALRRALPLLREQGFSFVTINDLMEYPAQ